MTDRDRNDRQVHFGMTAANDDAEAWREEAIRVIAKAKDERYYPACNGGPCNSGRKLCPTPAACRLADDDKTGLPWPPLARLGLIAAILIVLAGILGALR